MQKGCIDGLQLYKTMHLVWKLGRDLGERVSKDGKGLSGKRCKTEVCKRRRYQRTEGHEESRLQTEREGKGKLRGLCTRREHPVLQDLQGK